jgi:mitogen-activated protein kinase 1/3
MIGKGSFARVYLVEDKDTLAKYAVKAFSKEYLLSQSKGKESIINEIEIMQILKNEYVMNLEELHESKNSVYLVLELLEGGELFNYISGSKNLGLKDLHRVMKCLMTALAYLADSGVMHRDLKPSNILINAECDLKICDFGLSRGFGEVEEVLKKTAYVVTRWYRAPEVSLLNKSYNQSLDMWSVGCIFAELMQRSVLFPGDTNANEVIMILQLMGVPEDEDLKFIDNEQAMLFI